MPTERQRDILEEPTGDLEFRPYTAKELAAHYIVKAYLADLKEYIEQHGTHRFIRRGSENPAVFMTAAMVTAIQELLGEYFESDVLEWITSRSDVDEVMRIHGIGFGFFREYVEGHGWRTSYLAVHKLPLIG